MLSQIPSHRCDVADLLRANLRRRLLQPRENGFQLGVILELRNGDVGADREVSQTGAVFERTVSDAGDVGAYCDVGQVGGANERHFLHNANFSGTLLNTNEFVYVD